MKNIINTVLSTVGETPEGTPGGMLYAGLMSTGISFDKFQQIQAFCVSQGLVELRNDCWFPTAKLTGALVWPGWLLYSP